MTYSNSRNIRILNVTPTGDLGGRERQLLSISQSLKKDPLVQFDVIFIKAQGPFYEASLQEGIVTLQTPEGMLKALVYYLRIMRTYDVINYWGVNWQAYLAGVLSGNILTFSLQGARGVMRKRIKDVLLQDLLRKHKKSQVQPPQPVKKANDSIWKHRAVRFLKKWLLIHFLRRCAVVIVPSQYLFEFCLSYYGLKPKQIVIIKNAVDFESIKTTKTKEEIRQELGLTPGIFLVGVAARYDGRKRLDRLIDAMGELKEYDAIKAVIYGGGDDHIKRQLDLQIAEHKIDNKVLFPGFKADIYNYVNALDMFVLSSDSEGMGLSIVESVFLGCPTVVFQDGGGVLEVIKNKMTGYVVTDVQELSNLILSLYKNPELSQNICKQGRLFVIRNFDVHVTAAEYGNLFIKVAI